MAYLETNGVRLFYTDEGSGPPVVMVHGWTCDSHDWSWQIPAFLGTGHRVIALDLRGHGRSSVPADGYDPRTFAADIAGLLRARETGPVIALGHSLGGCIVSALAVEYPNLVRAIVPVDSAYGVAPELIAGVLGPLIGGMKTQGAAGAAPLFERFYTPATPANLPAWHRRRMEACPAHVLWQVMDGLFLAPDQFGQRPESELYFEGRACPVLSFFADPGRAAWEQTTFRHPASRAVACEGAGHWLHQERPAEFNAITLGWIASLTA